MRKSYRRNVRKIWKKKSNDRLDNWRKYRIRDNGEKKSNVDNIRRKNSGRNKRRKR